MSRLLPTLIACLTSAVVLAGCGGEADTPAGSTEATEATESPEPSEAPESLEPEAPEFDPATATLPDSPFCDDLDVVAAESALGLGNGQLELVAERVVGKKYKNPFGDSAVSTSNTCEYSDSGRTASFAVAIGPGASAKDLQAYLKAMGDYVGAQGQSDSCEVKTEATYGDPGGVVLCTAVAYSQKGRARVEVIGLVGDSRFYCSGSLTKGSTPEQLEQPVRDLCGEVLEQRAAG